MTNWFTDRKTPQSFRLELHKDLTDTLLRKDDVAEHVEVSIGLDSHSGAFSSWHNISDSISDKKAKTRTSIPSTIPSRRVRTQGQPHIDLPVHVV